MNKFISLIKQHKISIIVTTVLIFPAAYHLSTKLHGPYPDKKGGLYYGADDLSGYVVLALILLIALLFIFLPVTEKLEKKYKALERAGLTGKMIKILLLTVYWLLGIHILSQIIM